MRMRREITKKTRRMGISVRGWVGFDRPIADAQAIREWRWVSMLKGAFGQCEIAHNPQRFFAPATFAGAETGNDSDVQSFRE